MSWDSSNVVCFTERPDPKSGLSYFVITSGGYFCNVFLREDMNLLFQPQSPKEWTSRTPLTREQIARETTRLNGHCEDKGIRLERVPDRHGATPRVSTVEILETDVGGGRATMAVRNGYFIKEDLKPLGFKWGGTHREWRIPNGLYLEERREISRKIDMACVQVKFMELRCKYVPLTRSSDVAPALTTAAAPTEASGVPEVHQRELVPATVLRAPSHINGGDSLTRGTHGGGLATLKTETSQPLHPIKSFTTTDEPYPAGGDGNGKAKIDRTSISSTSTKVNNAVGMEKALEAQAPTAITKHRRSVKSRKTTTTVPDNSFAAALNTNGATTSTSTNTSTGPTSPSKTQMSSFFVERADGERLFVFGQKFNIGSKTISPRKQNLRHNMLPFRLEMGSSVATTEGSAPSTIKHQPGNFSIPPTCKYSSSSSSTTSANSASSPSSAVIYPPSPVDGNKKAQDLCNVPMFTYRNGDRVPQKESPDIPLFAHRHDYGGSPSTSSTGGRTRGVRGRRDPSDGVDDTAADSDSDNGGARSGGGGRRLENEFGDIPLVCREPPSWVSLAFSSETCQPRFSPMMSSSGEGQEGDAGGDCRERSPCWPSMLHSVEVSVGGRGLQARRAMQCLLSSSSGARGPLDGVLVWRKETGCWWTTVCGTQVWGSKRNVTLDFLRASLETMTALVVGVEFRDLTEGAERAPPLRCRKHDRDLVEEEEGEEENDLEKAVSGGVSGSYLRRSRTRRMVSICPVNRESCTMVPHDGLLSKRREMPQCSSWKQSTHASDTPGTAASDTPGTADSDTPDTAASDTPGTAASDTPGTAASDTPGTAASDTPGTASVSTSEEDETEKAGERVAEIGREICSSFAKRLNMDNVD